MALSTTGSAEIYYTIDGSGAGSKSARRYTSSIPITNTTIVRAWARQSGNGAAEVITRSYIFPAEVLRQTGAGFPATWGEKKGKPVPASYGICPQLAQDSTFAPELDRGLRAIATMPTSSPPKPVSTPIPKSRAASGSAAAQ